MYRGNTDAEGRFDWKSAPKDAVQFDIYKSGYMPGASIPLAASDAEQVVVLHPELSVSGRVTDATTGRAAAELPDHPRDDRSRGRTRSPGRGTRRPSSPAGATRETFDMPMKGWHLRVEAPGYKPADSRAFRSDEGRTTQDFALERADADLRGVVLLPDGKPAAGAEVALATRGVYVSLRGAGFDRNYNVPDHEGRAPTAGSRSRRRTTSSCSSPRATPGLPTRPRTSSRSRASSSSGRGAGSRGG